MSDVCDTCTEEAMTTQPPQTDRDRLAALLEDATTHLRLALAALDPVRRTLAANVTLASNDDRLRAALEMIRDFQWTTPRDTAMQMHLIAKTALEAAQPTPEPTRETRCPDCGIASPHTTLGAEDCPDHRWPP
jgi:hypothetical protein